MSAPRDLPSLRSRLVAAGLRRSLRGVAGVVGLVGAVVLLAILLRVGESGGVSLDGAAQRVGVGFLLAGGAAYIAYPILFRGTELPFLRRLGIPGERLYRDRVATLAAAVGGLALLVAIPMAAGGGLDGPGATRLAALAGLAWGGAAWAHARGAALLVARTRGEGRGSSRSPLIPWDRELAGAAPLVYVPLFVLGVGVTGAIVVGLFPGGALVAGAGAVVLALRGGARYRSALPRFVGRAEELAWSPPPTHGEEGLVIDDGVWRLLPRRVAAVRGRDAVLLARGRRWAYRLVGPALALAAVGLFRARTDPGVAVWVAVLGVGVLVLQAAAVAGLSRDAALRGTGWMERGLGLRGGARFVGRAACALGPTLVFGVPFALLWALFGAPGPAWWWPALATLAALAGAAPTLPAGESGS